MRFWKEIKIAVQSNLSAFDGHGLLHQFRSSAGILFSLYRDQLCFQGAAVALQWSLSGVCSLYVRSGEQRDSSPRSYISKTSRPVFSTQWRMEMETTSIAVGLILHWCCLDKVFVLNARSLCCLAKKYCSADLLAQKVEIIGAKISPGMARRGHSCTAHSSVGACSGTGECSFRSGIFQKEQLKVAFLLCLLQQYLREAMASLCKYVFCPRYGREGEAISAKNTAANE